MSPFPNKRFNALQIKHFGDVRRHKTFPKIRLQGKWLEQLDFKPNGRVRVVPAINGELLLKFMDE